MAEAQVTKDPKVKASKMKYNRASKYLKRQIARVRSDLIAEIGEKLESVRNSSLLGALKGGWNLSFSVPNIGVNAFDSALSRLSPRLIEERSYPSDPKERRWF